MVVVPEGFFLMGGAPADQRRWNVELPQHLVRVARQFAIGKYEVTFDEFNAFVDTTGHQPTTRCNVFVLDLDRWVGKSTTFRDPHYAQGGSHPVSCVSWLDAKAYTAWLSEKTGKPYRLPSEAEWEYAARAGTTTPMSFGDYAHKGICDYAKYADASTRFAWKELSCSSNFGHGAAPVGRHRPNPWGSTTCTATSGNGSRIAGMPATTTPPQTESPGWTTTEATARIASREGARGATPCRT
jgi:formylglycine-generating enzyme required for sulfatase activity